MTLVNNEPERVDFTFNYTKSTGFYGNIIDKRLNPIPSNTIIYKSLPGIGATTVEIKEPRNSIIILPNLPVIKGKQEIHAIENNTIAVYEDIHTNELIEYLSRQDILFKTILTTPESFLFKVKVAMQRLSINMYEEYFLLFDEGHKYLLDNSYRENLILPFDDFFKFKSKAIISATPLRFSDPRFKEQGFINGSINPIYNVKKELKLINTNNIAYALRKQIQTIEDNNYCIFYNSIDGIKSLIDSLGISPESNIFCSAFSRRELEIQKYVNVFSEFNLEVRLKKYNFFTSSFYNGLDIKLEDIKPTLIIITTAKYADHTVVDPYTDTIQIVGRIRNGVSNIIHITDTHDKIHYKTPQQIVDEFNTSGEVYQAIKTLKMAATTQFAQKLYSEVLERIFPYVNLLNKPVESQKTTSVDEDVFDEESINYFKLDNYFYQNKVREYYSSIENLIEAYERTKAFNINYEIFYSLVDKIDLLKRFGGKHTSPEVYLDITNILNEIEGFRISEPYEYQRQVTVLRRQFPLIVGAYFKLPITEMLALNFNHRKIQRAVILHDSEVGMNSHPIIDAIYITIGSIKKLSCSKIKEILQDIYKEHNINRNAKASDIERYYDTRDIKVLVKKKWQRGYEFIAPKYNIHHEYSKKQDIAHFISKE